MAPAGALSDIHDTTENTNMYTPSPFPFGPLARKLAEAGYEEYQRLKAPPSQGLTNTVGNAYLLGKDINDGFWRGVKNETIRQSKPSQGLTNFVGAVDNAMDAMNPTQSVGLGIRTPRNIPLGTPTAYAEQVLNDASKEQQDKQQFNTSKPIAVSKKAPIASSTPADAPVLHSAVPSQNLFSMSDSQGNRQWVGLGRVINGYKVLASDPNGKSVTLEKDGKLHVVGLQGSAPTEYRPPSEYRLPSDASKAGIYSDPTADIPDSINGAGQQTSMGKNIADSFKFSPAQLASILENTKQSPYMTDEDRKRIMLRSDYMKKAESGQLDVGKKYFIPKLFDNGSVDFDVYTHQGQEQSM